MWDWFFSNEAWIIIASTILLLIFFIVAIIRLMKQNGNKKDSPQINLPGSRVISLVVWTTVFAIVSIAALAFLINLPSQNGINFITLSDAIQSWFIDHGIPILAIMLLSFVFYRVIRQIIPGVITRSVKRRYSTGDAQEVDKRAQTLSRIIVSTIGVIIVIVSLLMILQELGRDITPLLASAGIAGIAIGFGAQSVVKDVLSGVPLLEDQYRHGDIISIAGLTGTVEDLSLRRTVLRDIDGTVHTIPNGEITTTSNLTRVWSRINMNIPIPYYENADRVMAVIDRVGKELSQDPNFKPSIINPPKAVRVDDFASTGLMIKVLGDTKAQKHWEVAGEFRRRLKIAFDNEKIEIPWAYGGVFAPKQVESNILTCDNCGTVNQSSSTFCTTCGKKLKKDENQDMAIDGVSKIKKQNP